MSLGFNLYFPKDQRYRTYFMCLFAFCISSDKVFKCFAHFVWFSCFSYYWVFGVLYISGYKSFMRFVICKYFLPVYGLSFHYLRVEILNFDEVQCIKVFFYGSWYWCFRNLFLTRLQRFSPMFSSESFVV